MRALASGVVGWPRCFQPLTEVSLVHRIVPDQAREELRAVGRFGAAWAMRGRRKAVEAQMIWKSRTLELASHKIAENADFVY
jgi:hypothetical protein